MITGEACNKRRSTNTLATYIHRLCVKINPFRCSSCSTFISFTNPTLSLFWRLLFLQNCSHGSGNRKAGKLPLMYSAPGEHFIHNAIQRRSISTQSTQICVQYVKSTSLNASSDTRPRVHVWIGIAAVGVGVLKWCAKSVGQKTVESCK